MTMILGIFSSIETSLNETGEAVDSNFQTMQMESQEVKNQYIQRWGCVSALMNIIWTDLWQYNYHCFLPFSDERTKDWFLIPSPVPTIVLSIIYVVYVKWLGPKMMENRKPMSLKYPLVLYNVALTALNFYIFKEVCFWLIVLSTNVFLLSL